MNLAKQNKENQKTLTGRFVPDFMSKKVKPRHPVVTCITESYISNTGNWELMHKTH